ncbi:hypothetical protein LMH87_012093 [Akanthomyces muscarius]|uniref:ABC transporter n=1 Tax=Akanthomyces muscarius TaxID=2231603 RepID=A0A9W8QB42_AKAMU|nr:hypothetical protein LMH87_012093 [Akanthomyces muscarius]KAJ4151391.1 hypothetical protein LMH87_012093 [Akanthomyces muscarius]
MGYLTAIRFHKEDVENLATTLISILGVLGIVTKLRPRRASLDHAELTDSRVAALLLGIAAAVCFVLESLWLGNVSMSWVMLASQSGTVLAEKSYKMRFKASAIGAIMSAAYMVSLYCGDASIAQGLVALLLLGAHLSVPRSADQYIDGKLVDRQATASILERISFTWAASSFDDKCANLPVLPASMRTATVASCYAECRDRAATLGRSLLQRFIRPIILQWFITIIRSVASVVPKYITYKLLEHLGTASSDSSRGFYLAIALGGCKLINAWLGPASSWMMDSQLLYPVQTILMALICDKSLRMPNVMSAKPSKGKPEPSIFAHMRMDGARASMVVTNSHTLPSVVMKLITTVYFLSRLIGWQILALTLSLTILLMGIGAKITQKHHQLQAELTEQRRESGIVLADALLSIRQIKLSASEDEWMRKISENRSKELKLRYKNSLITCASTLNNAVVSAVLAGIPLYLCALKGQKLTAAVAFTFLSLFQDLQLRLASLPYQVSYWVEGWNALQRLHSHFAASEAQKTTETVADEISLKEAVMAWNKDAHAQEQFELKASLDFPSGQLSVITGDTASGKSLLLTAIAGEAALLSGDLRAPIPQDIGLGGRAIGGARFATSALATLILSTALGYSRTRWLQKWTARYETLGKADSYAGSDAAHFGGVYLWISIVGSVVGAVTIYLSLHLGLRASRPMADAALLGVFHSPLQWLERTSRGEITSRLASDVEDLDRKVPEDIVDALRCGTDLLMILFTSASISGYETISTLLLGFIYYKITRNLMPATKKLQQLSRAGTSAMYQRLSDLQQHDALLTLRTFSMRDYFLHDAYARIDDRIRYWWYTSLCKVMLDVQLEAVSALFVTSIAVGAVLTHADAGPTGVALLFANKFSAVTSRLLKRLVDVQGDMASVARVDEYANLPAEKMDGAAVPDGWPPRGALQVSDLTAGYEADLGSSCVLKQVSFSVKAAERVGIVGRTGAGKSSLVLALTRHLHMQGRIAIDGVDLANLNLKQLRRSLSVISQDPYLFSGTLRHVVDPAGTHSDDEIQAVLSKMCFSTAPQGSASSKAAAAVAAELSFGISRGGLNLSQGQRQMLRLAQAVLARRRIVVMDEATSAVDADADAAIQRALREMTATTLLVVAHRLATVADFDRLLVLDDGRLVESGSPAALYRANGAFTKMVDASADKEALLRMFVS